MFQFLNLDNASKAEKEILHTILFNKDGSDDREQFFKDLKPSYEIIRSTSEPGDVQELSHQSSLREVENSDTASNSNDEIQNDNRTQQPDIAEQAVAIQNNIPMNNSTPHGSHHQMRTYYTPGPIPSNPHVGGTGHPISHHPQMPMYHPQLVQAPTGPYYQQYPFQMQYSHPGHPPHGIGLPPHIQQQYISPEGSDPHQKIHHGHDMHHSSPGGQSASKFRTNKNSRPTQRRSDEINTYPTQYYPNMNYPPIYYTTQAVTNMTGTPLIMPGSTAQLYQHAHYTPMYPSPALGNELDHSQQQEHAGNPPHIQEHLGHPPRTTVPHHIPAPAQIQDLAQGDSIVMKSTEVPSVTDMIGSIAIAPSPSKEIVEAQFEQENVMKTDCATIILDQVQPEEAANNTNKCTSNVAQTKDDLTTPTNPESQEAASPIPPVVNESEPNINSSRKPINSKSQDVIGSSGEFADNTKPLVKTWSSTVNGGSAGPALKHSSRPNTAAPKKEYKESFDFPQLRTTNVPPTPTSSSQPVVAKSQGQSWASIASRKTAAPTNGITLVNNEQAPAQHVNESHNDGYVYNTDRNIQVLRGDLGSPTELSLNAEAAFENDPIALRLGEYLANYVLDHHTFSLTPRGLSNQSNFCYINATLQALVACPPFVNLFRSLQEIIGKKPCKSTPIMQSVYNFVMEFEPVTRVTQARNKNPSDTFYVGANFEASGIRKVLGLLDGVTFKVEGRQEDAEEFLSHILNGLHDEMIKVIKWSEIRKEKLTMPKSSKSPLTLPTANQVEDDDDNDQWQVMGPKNKGCMTRKTSLSKSPISEMFVGQMCSALNRANNLKSTTLQPFFTLQLDIQSENVHSIRDALDGLSLKEEVTGCISSNGVETEAWKQMSLEVLPTILILHMKRFVFDTTLNTIKKLDKRVDFSIDLEVAKDLLSINSKSKYTPKQRQYKLFAVVYHDGEEAIKGHYIADTFHPSGGLLWGQFGWIRYDDTAVKGVAEHQILNPQSPRVPYLLYYRRVDTLSQSKKDR